MIMTFGVQLDHIHTYRLGTKWFLSSIINMAAVRILTSHVTDIKYLGNKLFRKGRLLRQEQQQQ